MAITSIYLNPEFFFYKLFLFLQTIGLFDISGDRVIFTGGQYLFYFKLFLVFISVFGTFLIIDFLYRLFTVRKEEQAWELEQFLKNIPEKENENNRWREVERLLDSDNESDWKLAIVEADKMLDELLVVLGYQGVSLGDRLLAVEKGDMLSLDDAWEAHKYRNKIAHEPGFQVAEREAKRIVGMYKKVFQEYKFI
jgi:hypothetical protein